MKKKLFCLFSAILIVLCLATPVHAENAMGTGGYHPPMVTIITLSEPAGNSARAFSRFS